MASSEPATQSNRCQRPAARSGAVGLLALGLAFASTAPSVALRAATEKLVVLPERIRLHGPQARQGLLLEKASDGGFIGQVTNAIEWVSSDTNVVRVEGGRAVARGNGRARVTAHIAGQQATAEVSVRGFEQPTAANFRNHVQPILAKNGCSSGACHGAAAGKNGFRLSLRGYDDNGDYLAITRHAAGRRITPGDPARSLLLMKAVGALPHKGGRRFDIASPEFSLLADWIASGAPGPADSDPRIERIEILPASVTVGPGALQQFLVLAHFSDGTSEDVTSRTKYTSADSTVATVDDSGQAQVTGAGIGAVTAWYLSRIAIANITAPYPTPARSDVFASVSRRNFIDALVLAQLERLNLPPAPRCADSDFIRRVFIDSMGVLPTAEETRAFLADATPGKRDRLIDTILNRPEFIDYWTYRLSDLLLVSSKKLKPSAMAAFSGWIRLHVARNTPWDRLVRELITVQGSSLENGAANFFILHEDPRLLAENTSQAFLGMSINCARCHNHPMEKWTNDQYYQMASLFARVRTKSGALDGEWIVFTADDGELVQPVRGRAQPPAPLDAAPMPPNETRDRRAFLADWLVAPGNPYFSRAIVNRIWANYLGKGLVEKVDDLRITNPASNEPLLAALAVHLGEQQFNLRAFMRTLLQSETYQRSSVPQAESAADQRHYAYFYPRRLLAEVLLDAYSQVTGVPTPFPNYPAGWRALQLPDSNVDSYFLKSFGRPERNTTCECERTTESSVAQVLHLANGETLNRKLAAKNNHIDRLLATAGDTPARFVEEAFLTALSRLPSPAETTRLAAAFERAGSGDERRSVAEDVVWALLTSNEFLFNH